MRWTAALFVIASLHGIAVAQAPELPPVGGKPSEPPAPPLPPLTVPGEADGPARLQPPRPGSALAADLELIEKVLEARRTYANSLKALYEHYQKVGDSKRMQMADDELRQFHRLPHPVYRLELDVPSAKLQPTQNQREANELYRWALSYKDKGLGSDYQDNQRR